MDCLNDLWEWSTIRACIVVMLSPLLWNGVSRLEFYTGIVSKAAGGPRKAVVLLAVAIAMGTYLRTRFFYQVMETHAICSYLDGLLFDVLGYIFIIIGQLFTFSSAWRLGFFAVFMGDYFGILLDKRVTSFPFNVLDDPMYVGSVLTYLGFSFIQASVIGFILCGCIGLSYGISACFERPFTTKIYSNRKKNF